MKLYRVTIVKVFTGCVMDLKQVLVLDGIDICRMDSESAVMISTSSSLKLQWKIAEILSRIKIGSAMKCANSLLW
jgi:hypothetical protein